MMNKFIGFIFGVFMFISTGVLAAIVTGVGTTGFGTQTNDNAATGYIGQYITASTSAASAVSLTTATAANVVSSVLGAGDWQVQGVVCYHTTGTTLITDLKQGLGTSSVMPTTVSSFTYNYVSAVTSTTDDACQVTPTVRVSLANAASGVFLETLSDFSVSTVGAYGTLNALRVH